jgi:hypothetical protein
MDSCGSGLGLVAHVRLINTYHAVPMQRPCRSLPCHAAKGLDCVFPVWFTQCGCVHTCHAAPMPQPCHATTMPFWKRLLKAMAQRGMGIVWHVYISIGRLETACGRLASVRLLPATTRTFTKDTTLSENGRGAAWYGRGAAWYGRGAAWYGRGAALAWHGMCQLAFTGTRQRTFGLLKC